MTLFQPSTSRSIEFNSAVQFWRRFVTAAQIWRSYDERGTNVSSAATEYFCYDFKNEIRSRHRIIDGKIAQCECVVQKKSPCEGENHGTDQRTKLPACHIGIMTPAALDIFRRLFSAGEA